MRKPMETPIFNGSFFDFQTLGPFPFLGRSTWVHMKSQPVGPPTMLRKNLRRQRKRDHHLSEIRNECVYIYIYIHMYNVCVQRIYTVPTKWGPWIFKLVDITCLTRVYGRNNSKQIDGITNQLIPVTLEPHIIYIYINSIY